ncbi:unnamed protein product [Leuciscus chuanchicus]
MRRHREQKSRGLLAVGQRGRDEVTPTVAFFAGYSEKAIKGDTKEFVSLDSFAVFVSSVSQCLPHFLWLSGKN